MIIRNIIPNINQYKYITTYSKHTHRHEHNHNLCTEHCNGGHDTEHVPH